MPRMGYGWPEMFPVGSGGNPVPKPTVNKETRRRTMREMYVGKRFNLVTPILAQNANLMPEHAKTRLRAWIEGFMRDDWGKNKQTNDMRNSWR